MRYTKLQRFSPPLLLFSNLGVFGPLHVLHDWIVESWRPILSTNIQIYPIAMGFFIVKFENVEDRTILCNYSFSWEDRFPLMAKPWHKDFNPLIESFNKIPVWDRLLNLPIHL